MTLRRVAARSALPEDQGTVALVGERQVALFRAGEQVYAYPNVCLHKGGPVGEGLVIDEISLQDAGTRNRTVIPEAARKNSRPARFP